jgi:hypothetical protein
MGRTIERAQRLDKEIEAITSAGPLMRLYVVTTNFDPEVARSALDNYEPAEPLSIGALTARRPRGALGMGGRSPHRMAVQPPLAPSRRLAARDAGTLQTGRGDKATLWLASVERLVTLRAPRHCTDHVTTIVWIVR